MKTANLYSEVPIGLPKWESVSESAELGDSEKLAEFLSPTIKDIVQFKALVTMCPNFTPIAKFALGEDNLRLVQVTLVDPDYVKLVGKQVDDA